MTAVLMVRADALGRGPRAARLPHVLDALADQTRPPERLAKLAGSDKRAVMNAQYGMSVNAYDFVKTASSITIHKDKQGETLEWLGRRIGRLRIE